MLKIYIYSNIYVTLLILLLFFSNHPKGIKDIDFKLEFI